MLRNKSNAFSPSDSRSLLEDLLRFAEDHAEYFLHDALVAMYGRREGTCELLKHILCGRERKYIPGIRSPTTYVAAAAAEENQL